MEPKSRYEEIDLLEVLARFFHYLLKNWIVVVLLPVLGGIMGFVFSANTEDRLESKMLVHSEILSITELDFLLSQLEQSRPFAGVTSEMQDNFTGLAHKMTLQVGDPKLKSDVYAEITIWVSNREYLPDFQMAILDFLENSDVSQQRKKTQREYYTILVNKISHELKLLDDVKTHTAYEAQANALKPSDLFTAAVDLTSTKTNYEMKLKDTRAVTLVQGFNQVLNVKKSQRTLILVGIASGLLLMLVVLFLKYFLNYYKEYRKNHLV